MYLVLYIIRSNYYCYFPHLIRSFAVDGEGKEATKTRCIEGIGRTDSEDFLNKVLTVRRSVKVSI